MRTLHATVSILGVMALTISTFAAPQSNFAAKPRVQTAPKPSAAASTKASSPTGTSATETAAQLPVRRVILYKTGDGGSFTVLEEEAFAGEGLIDPVKPGEKRLVSYAADLGVRVDKKMHGEPQRVVKVRVIHGTMIQTRATREDTIYTARNEDTAPRALLIEHALRPGWNLSSDTPKAEETTATDYRFRMNLGPKAATTLVVPNQAPSSPATP